MIHQEFFDITITLSHALVSIFQLCGPPFFQLTAWAWASPDSSSGLDRNKKNTGDLRVKTKNHRNHHLEVVKQNDFRCQVSSRSMHDDGLTWHDDGPCSGSAEGNFSQASLGKRERNLRPPPQLLTIQNITITPRKTLAYQPSTAICSHLLWWNCSCPPITARPWQLSSQTMWNQSSTHRCWKLCSSPGPSSSTAAS